MNYRAVPFRALLRGMALAPGEDVEVVARDGFVTTLPSALVFLRGGGARCRGSRSSRPTPWPPAVRTSRPGRSIWSARPRGVGVRTEQWPFAVAAVRPAPSPLALAPDRRRPGRPRRFPIRAGQALFVTQCMVCHTLNGAGSAEVGPDLNLPHNPTDYLQPWALKSLIRDPGSVRRWPDMRMTGFDATALPDADRPRGRLPRPHGRAELGSARASTRAAPGRVEARRRPRGLRFRRVIPAQLDVQLVEHRVPAGLVVHRHILAVR